MALLPDFMSEIQKLLDAARQAREDAIETLCWKMLAQQEDEPKMGVLVTDEADGSWKVELSPHVPFMNIYVIRPGVEFP